MQTPNNITLLSTSYIEIIPRDFSLPLKTVEHIVVRITFISI